MRIATSASAAAMMCIPSANLELLAALQQDLHASLAGALALERWECAHDAARAAAATSAVTVVALGTRWARPCRALFGALARAVARYAEVAAAGVPVALRCVDHEASASFDLERVPIGVPATLVFVHGEPILFRLPVSPSASASASSATTGTTPAATTNQHSQDDDEDNEDEQEDEDDEEDEEGTITIYGNPKSYAAIQKHLEECGFEDVGGDFTYIPNDMKEVTPEQRETLDKMIERLEEFDDVQTVYTNMQPEEGE